MSVESKEERFHKLVKDWADADKECRRTYLQWCKANEKRRKLVVYKNEAWKELQTELTHEGKSDVKSSV